MKWNAIDYPVEDIRRMIQEGSTQQHIADLLRERVDKRITPKLIYKVCKKYGIQCQRTGPRAGPGHPEWRGGRVKHKHSYVKIYCPNHPVCVARNERLKAKANGAYYRKSKYVWEHRLVMEKHLGRYLLPKEVVHHINGIRDDNRIENLVLFSHNGEHLKHELAGKCPKWSPAGKERILAANRRRKSMKYKPKRGASQQQ